MREALTALDLIDDSLEGMWQGRSSGGGMLPAGALARSMPKNIQALYQQGMEEYAKAGPLVEYMTKIVDDAQRTRQIREQYAEGFAAYDAEQGKNQIIQAEDGAGKTEAETELTRPDAGSTIGEKDIEECATKICNIVEVDKALAIERSKTGDVHGGVYREAQKKSRHQLWKSISSRTAQVEEHAKKVQSPELYDKGWAIKSDVEKRGLLKKWEKDLRRNAEQAAIEIEVWKERFGHES